MDPLNTLMAYKGIVFPLLSVITLQHYIQEILLLEYIKMEAASFCFKQEKIMRSSESNVKEFHKGWDVIPAGKLGPCRSSLHTCPSIFHKAKEQHFQITVLGLEHFTKNATPKHFLVTTENSQVQKSSSVGTGGSHCYLPLVIL